MAILNFIKSGTYSTVDVLYRKQIPYAIITLSVWENSTKTNLLTDITYHLDGKSRHLVVESIITALPENPMDTTNYLIGEDAVEDLLPFIGVIATYDVEKGGWTFSIPHAENPIYVKDLGIHLKRVDIDKGRNPASPLWSKAVNVFDCYVWDKWFSTSCIGGVDENTRQKDILRSCYAYLMSRSEFQYTVEG